MVKYNVAVLGLGAIFSRHLSAIQANPEYNLIGVFDSNEERRNKYAEELNVKAYSNESAAYHDDAVNCIVIITPSHLHYEQAKDALNAGKHIIVEKPVAFSPKEVLEISELAKAKNLDAFCVLQVRLNPAVNVVKKVLASGILGDIRNVGLIQRWQRGANYFAGWRGSYATGGGVLSEFGIHYMDIMQYLVGVPHVVGAHFKSTKFSESAIHDTVYALLDFGSFAGSLEISLSAEPSNIEVGLFIGGSNGFIKLAGKSLDVVEEAKFLDDFSSQKYQEIEEEVSKHKITNLANTGASPHHPELYRNFIVNKEAFHIANTVNVISLIENIYSFK